MQRDMIASTRRLAKTGLAIQLCALALIAVMRSDKMVILAYDLPPGPASERFIAVAEVWDGWMQTAGFAGLRETALEAVGAMRGETDAF